ncbi:MAG: hypothetical protein CL679_10845 [Bermanella sp.]|jgi:hypothetical protein|nr:hypothetical protein [Bermanella sp.]
MKNQTLLASAILSATLVGCGSSSSSNDTVDNTFTPCADSATECVLKGVLKEDFTLKNGVEYTLDDVFQIGEGNGEIADAAGITAVKAAGVTLTIEPGVEVNANDDGVLLVTRGSKLDAEGTAANPITFASSDAGYDGTGEWGGVVIQGFAPQYGAGDTGVCGTVVCNVAGEGGDFVGNYGGADKADNSGIIKYVRIAEAGKVAGPNNELNGLTLQGVGHGTTVDYVQVHGNLDDGIEWFGGTVNVTHAVLTNNDDDDIDFDEGYQGNIQHVIIMKDQDDARTGPYGSNDPRAIEANSSDEDYVPQTAATIANVSILGSKINNVLDSEEPGMRLRGSVTANIYNTVVAGFTDQCVRIDYSDDDADDTTAKIPSVVNLTNIVASDCGSTFKKENPDTNVNLVEADITFDTAFALTSNGTVASTTPVATDNGSNFVFDTTTYVGAVEPGTAAASAWYADWIIDGSLDQ